ncbi:MAG: mechanosensitive ion channel domain-containing protein [Desulfobacterales bacterium]
MSQRSKLQSLWVFAFLILLAAILNPSLVNGQNAPSAASSQPSVMPSQSAVDLSLEKLRLKRSEVEASQNLDKAGKDSAIQALDQAIGFRELLDEFNRQSEALSGQIKTAPQRIKAIQSELAQPLPPPEKVKVPAAENNALQLEQRVQREMAQLVAAKDRLAGWNDQLSKQNDLLEQLPKNTAAARARLNLVNEKLQSPPSAGDPAAINESRRLMLRAEQLKLSTEIQLYEQQLNSHEILVSLITAERDLASREAVGREILVKEWQAQAAEKFQQEAVKVREESEEAKEKTPESAAAVKNEYDINIALSAELEEVARQETAVTKALEDVTNRLKEIEDDFAMAAERVDSLVLTEAIGLALRRQRQLLPSADKYRRSSAERKNKMGEIREIQYRLDRQRRELSDIDSQTDQIIDSLVYLTPDKAETLRPNVRNLLMDRRQLLEKLQAANNRYFNGLQNLEIAEQQLVLKAEAYADFLDTHLVWIRSSSIVSFTDLQNSLNVLRNLVDPARWRRNVSDAVASFWTNPGLWVLGLLISAMLLFGRRWARREISRTAERVNHQRQDSFSLTLWVLSLTVYLAAGLPFLIMFVAWQLLQLPGVHDFTRAVATGLMTAAGMLIGLRFFYNVCRRNGLAHVHFKWNEPIRQSLRRNLWWLTPVVVLMGFFVSAMATVKEFESGDSLAKLALIIQMVAVSAFFGRILRFSGGIVTALLKTYPSGWLARLRYIGWPLAVGLPLFLAALAASGYFLSALEFRDLIRLTALLAMTLVVLNSLALRWLSLASRRFAIQEARRKREAQREAARQKLADGDPSPADEENKPILPEPEIGLAEISDQTQTLLRTVMFIVVAIGLWAIWEPVFPAFGILQDVQFWSYSGVVNGVATQIPINLGNLLMAGVVVVFTIIASKNLPGLLEITILNRLPVDAGARYAFTTLCRYAITAIGFLLAFNTIGFRWSSVQWLVAALGVGLGFGLQEIVANFICGLIVLFERPFRVGDTVTIGEVNGTVSRIRIRATTIIDWDRKELIVPNKEFITGQLINWSLSDPIVRFSISVGIAYGSDTELAEKLLLKVLHETPMVLQDPKPTAYFLGFGDNSLNFQLRLFINNIDHRLPVQHELHKAVDREFRKAGIVIAFPQRDVHFDSDQPLKIEVMSDKPKTAPEGPEPESDKSEAEPDASQ